MSIYIIQGKRNLHTFLKRRKVSGPVQYVLPAGNDLERELLEQCGIEEFAQEKISRESREKFLKEYVDLVGSISRECNSKVWWATDISSKNRGTSHLPDLLQEFISIIESISRATGKDLLIVEPSRVLVNSLKAYLSKQNMPHRHFPDSWSIRKEIIFMRVVELRRVLYALLKASICKIYFKVKLRKRIRELSGEKAYYVIKTFLFDHSFSGDGRYKDTFFGSLPDFLKQQENVLILAHILGDDRSLIEKTARCKSHLILPIEVFLSFKDAFGAALEVAFARIEIKQACYFFGLDVTAIVNEELQRTGNGVCLYQLLHYWMTRRLLETVKVQTFLLTYENNPWEKMCMMAIRELSPRTEIIGYQHTIVPQASANAFISRNEADVIPLPDRILTVGRIPKEMMERYGSYERGKIEPACGLRFEYLFSLPESERRNRGHILLAADGIYEAYKLVNYVIGKLNGKMNYQVLIRTHPALPFELFEDKLTHPLKDLQNFTLSQGALLKDDLEWADLIIYWGSTVSLEAISMGKPVIRYDMDSVFNNDPLSECVHLKWTAGDDTPLVDTVEEIYALDNSRFAEAQIKARQYVADYFFPVNKKNLELFLSEGKRRMADDLS